MKSSAGFTLVELLITIAIIAILTTVGAVSYGNVQMNARDSKRQAEIEAIAKALETSKAATSFTYPALLNSSFATGLVPTDPGATGTPARNYCITTTTADVNAANPTAWGTSACSLMSGTGITGANWSVPANSNPAAGASVFKVCASLESGTVFCRKNQQ